jgi:hypothetical protein
MSNDLRTTTTHPSTARPTFENPNKRVSGDYDLSPSVARAFAIGNLPTIQARILAERGVPMPESGLETPAFRP